MLPFSEMQWIPNICYRQISIQALETHWILIMPLKKYTVMNLMTTFSFMWPKDSELHENVIDLSMYEPNRNIQNSNFEVTLPQLLPLILSNSMPLSICSLKNQDQSTLDELGCITTAQHLPIMFTVLSLILRKEKLLF